MKLFKMLYENWECIYLYQTGSYFMVEFKTYVEDIGTAQLLKKHVESIIERFEVDGK